MYEIRKTTLKELWNKGLLDNGDWDGGVFTFDAGFK